MVTISAATASAGGTGSGIILDADGDILTNMHVVTLDGAAANAAIDVRTSDGGVYPGTVVGTDALADLAVVRIDAEGLVPAALGDSAKVNVGDTAIAIGAPLGLSGTVTAAARARVARAIVAKGSATHGQLGLSGGVRPGTGEEHTDDNARGCDQGVNPLPPGVPDMP